MNFNYSINQLNKHFIFGNSPQFGDIYLMHKNILKNFGSNKKPWHYSIQSEIILSPAGRLRFVPITSKRISKSKSCFELNFTEDTDIKSGNLKDSSFAFFFFNIKIRLKDVRNKKYSIYKGKFIPNVLDEYKEYAVKYYKLNNIR